LAISSFLGNWFLYEDYEKQVFLCCQQEKIRYRFAGYFIYGMAYYSSLLPLRVTGYLYSVAAAAVFFIGVWMLFYAVKTL
jgi:protoheme IX farnesyltransferase